jgi:hypothetical protein
MIVSSKSIAVAVLLAKALQVPYIALMDPQESSFTLVPSDNGMDWRFGLNLVSIEY